MHHSKSLLTLAVATALASPSAASASGDTLTLEALNDSEIVSGRAGELYAELNFENWLPEEPTNNPGRADVLIWNFSGTPHVAYEVDLTVRCTGKDAWEHRSGVLANNGQVSALSVYCGEGNVTYAFATIVNQ